jgi:hypothetical protein
LKSWGTLSEVTLDGVPCMVEDFHQGRVDFGWVHQQKWWILASKECDLTNKSWLVGALEHVFYDIPFSWE